MNETRNPPAGDLLAGMAAAGRSSRRAVLARKLCRQGAQRDVLGLFVAEGIRLAEEVLTTRSEIEFGLVSPRLSRSPRGGAILAALRSSGRTVQRVTDRQMASICDVETHQGILLAVRMPGWSFSSLLQGPGGPSVVVAAGIQDPGNLGALARVAEASWCTGLLCWGGADPWSPRSLRASAGSLLRLPHWRITDILSALPRLRRQGLELVGASARAGPAYSDSPLEAPFALFLGGEGAGLPPEAESRLDRLVRIPMREGIESLNVTAAAAVLLFDAAVRAGLSRPADRE